MYPIGCVRFVPFSLEVKKGVTFLLEKKLNSSYNKYSKHIYFNRLIGKNVIVNNLIFPHNKTRLRTIQKRW